VDYFNTTFWTKLHITGDSTHSHRLPSYFRTVAGSIRNVSSWALTTKEAGM
jgi:hypothetical protein